MIYDYTCDRPCQVLLVQCSLQLHLQQALAASRARLCSYVVRDLLSTLRARVGLQGDVQADQRVAQVDMQVAVVWYVSKKLYYLNVCLPIENLCRASTPLHLPPTHLPPACLLPHHLPPATPSPARLLTQLRNCATLAVAVATPSAPLSWRLPQTHLHLADAVSPLWC